MKKRLKYIIMVLILLVIAMVTTFCIERHLYNKKISEQMKNASHSITINDDVDLFSNINGKKKIDTLSIGSNAYILENVINKDGKKWCKVSVNGKIGYVDSENLDSYKKTTMKKELMLDVSKFNLQNNFKNIGEFEAFIVKNNIQYVYIRAGGRGYGEAGNFYTDPNVKEYSEACEYLGIDFGYYFLDEAITSEEVDEECEFINNFLNENQYEYNKLPIAIDVEQHVEKGRADGIWDTRYLLVDELIKKLEDSEKCALVYSNASVAHKYLTGVNAKMWLAYYPDITEVPDYWYSDTQADSAQNQELISKIVGWQFTEKGVKNKIDSKVDLSLVYSCYFENNSMNDIKNDIDGKGKQVSRIFYLKDKKKNVNFFPFSSVNNI